LFQAIFHPLGFPLTLLTNSLQVVDIAAEEWGSWNQLFEVSPVKVSIEVSTEGTAILPTITFTPGPDQVHWDGDASNHAIGNPARGTAQIWLSAAAANDSEWLRYYFLDAVATHLITSQHLTPFHAACVAREGRGVLLCGESQAGKTSLAYACARRGWTYVSDDGSYLVRRSAEQRLVVGSPHAIRMRPDAPSLFPELKDHPVVIRGNGKPILRVRPPFATAPTADVDRLVFLRRDAISQARLTPFDRHAARVWCEQWLYKWNPEVEAEQRVALDKMLDECRIEALEYSGLDAAVDQLG
jgi:hypothetical protein